MNEIFKLKALNIFHFHSEYIKLVAIEKKEIFTFILNFAKLDKLD